jgi:hypothetical protein
VRQITVGIVLLLLLAGCGGSGSSTYSRSALVACLRQHGAQILGMNTVPSAQRAALHTLIGSAKFFGAKFPGGEVDAFAFAADASDAKKIEAKMKRFAKGFPSSSTGPVRSKGNLVLLTTVHPAERVRKVISACEESAKRT